MSKQVADALGMPLEDFAKERLAGKTIGEIAQAQGVSEQKVIDAIKAPVQDVLGLGTKYGGISEKEAAWLKSVVDAVAPLLLTNPFQCQPVDAQTTSGFGFGRGMMRHGGFGGQMPWGAPPAQGQ
jgi:hypothetical protein